LLRDILVSPQEAVPMMNTRFRFLLLVLGLLFACALEVRAETTYYSQGSTHRYKGACGTNCTTGFAIVDRYNVIQDTVSGTSGEWLPLTWDVPEDTGYSVMCRCGTTGDYDGVVLEDITVCANDLEITYFGTSPYGSDPELVDIDVLVHYTINNPNIEILELWALAEPFGPSTDLSLLATLNTVVIGEETDWQTTWVTGIDNESDDSPTDGTDDLATTRGPQIGDPPAQGVSMYASLGSGHQSWERTEYASDAGTAITILKAVGKGGAPLSSYLIKKGIDVLFEPKNVAAVPDSKWAANGKKLVLETTPSCATRYIVLAIRDPMVVAVLTATPETSPDGDDEPVSVQIAASIWANVLSMRKMASSAFGWEEASVDTAIAFYSGLSFKANNVPAHVYAPPFGGLWTSGRCSLISTRIPESRHTTTTIERRLTMRGMSKASSYGLKHDGMESVFRIICSCSSGSGFGLLFGQHMRTVAWERNMRVLSCLRGKEWLCKRQGSVRSCSSVFSWRLRSWVGTRSGPLRMRRRRWLSKDWLSRAVWSAATYVM
jgi:hypothetical protein